MKYNILLAVSTLLISTSTMVYANPIFDVLKIEKSKNLQNNLGNQEFFLFDKTLIDISNPYVNYDNKRLKFENLLTDKKKPIKSFEIIDKNTFSNCHGITFTGGEFIILNDQIQAILDDEYLEVTEDKLQNDDIVIYYKESDNSIIYSAKVFDARNMPDVKIQNKNKSIFFANIFNIQSRKMELFEFDMVRINNEIGAHQLKRKFFRQMEYKPENKLSVK